MALVTDIRTPRPGSRARDLIVDGETWRRTSSDVLRALEVRVGHIAPLDDLGAALDRAEPPAARERALRMLSYRDRSARELVQRLADDGYPRTLAEDLVADLSHSGLVDDERVAASAARNLTHTRGFGRARAARELAARGIAPDLVQRALDEALPADDELEAARLLARALATRPGTDPGRIAARLVRKGYRQALAIRVAREALGEASGPFDANGEDDAVLADTDFDHTPPDLRGSAE